MAPRMGRTLRLNLRSIAQLLEVLRYAAAAPITLMIAVGTMAELRVGACRASAHSAGGNQFTAGVAADRIFNGHTFFTTATTRPKM